MKAPAHLHRALPDVASDRRRAAVRRLWRRRLLNAGGVLLAVALLFAAMAVLHEVEGDLRQVNAPEADAASTALA